MTKMIANFDLFIEEEQKKEEEVDLSEGKVEGGKLTNRHGEVIGRKQKKPAMAQASLWKGDLFQEMQSMQHSRHRLSCTLRSFARQEHRSSAVDILGYNNYFSVACQYANTFVAVL
jgi:hypothetical protein